MSQASIVPSSKPRWNHSCRSAEVPWVKLSVDPAGRILLDAVVADGRRRGQALLEVASSRRLSS